MNKFKIGDKAKLVNTEKCCIPRVFQGQIGTIDTVNHDCDCCQISYIVTFDAIASYDYGDGTINWYVSEDCLEVVK